VRYPLGQDARTRLKVLVPPFFNRFSPFSRSPRIEIRPKNYALDRFSPASQPLKNRENGFNGGELDGALR
jgi:hypothetical protein